MLKGLKNDLGAALGGVESGTRPRPPGQSLRDSLREARNTVLAEANNFANSPAHRHDAQERLLNIENDYDRKLGPPKTKDPGLQSLYEARAELMAELNNLAGPAGKPGPERDEALQRFTNIMNAIARAESSPASQSTFTQPRRPLVSL